MRSGSRGTAAALAAAVLLGALVLGACSDDEERAMGGGPATVLVLDEATRLPVEGIEIVVMDGVSGAPLAGPAPTGEDGSVVFEGLPLGEYPVLAFGGIRYLFHGLFPVRLHVTVPPGRTGEGPLGPAGVTAPEYTPPTFLAYAIPPDSLPRFRGTVVDADSDAPLAGAFLGTSAYPVGYDGFTGPRDDVTGPDGAFSVSGIPVSPNPLTGNLEQQVPLKVVRHGYRPVHYVHDFPNGSEDTDVAGLVIRLTRTGPRDTGSIAGRIAFRDGPAARAPVALGFVEPGAKSGPGLTGWSTVTDADGRFLVTGLPDGRYLLTAGHLPEDGVVDPEYLPVEVAGGAAVDVGDHPVLREVDLVDPPRGAVLGVQPTRLDWYAVPGAVAYEVFLDRGILGRTDVPRIDVPPDAGLLPALHVWYVQAYAAGDTLIGSAQTQSFFRITYPGTPLR